MPPTFIHVSPEYPATDWPESDDGRQQTAVAPGEVQSFDDVYALHAAFVFRVLRGMGVPDAHVDDAMQDVFLVVHRRLPEFDWRARVTTWLFRIAVNTALSYRRRARRTRDQTPLRDVHVGSAEAPPDTGLYARDLERVLDALDDDKRATLLLSDMEQLTAPEIAKLTGAPTNTVYARVRRARKAFAEIWMRTHGELP